MNEYFWNLAQVSAQIANEEHPDVIDPKWILSQWHHETGDFTSEMCNDYHNLGGLTQTTPNDTPQPDGDFWYMQFATFEDCASYFGKYLKYYEENGIFNSTCLEDYVKALKDGGYFGDSLENYIAGCNNAYQEEFACC